MSTDEINARIAQACGWKHEIRRSYREAPGWFHPNGISLHDYPPDYCSDLNAIAEAEKTLPQATAWDTPEQSAYMTALEEIVGGCDSWRLITATAMQRAQAFLQVLGERGGVHEP